MQYDKDYVRELENLIMDTLLPSYIEFCRSKGIDPKSHLILRRLLGAKKLRKEVPILLRKE